MRMVCEAYGLNYQFRENNTVELLIDSADIFQVFVSRLWNQYIANEDFIIFSETDKEVRLDKIGDIILNPIQIDNNNRKIITQIYQDLMQESMDNNQELLYDLQTQMEQFIIEICDHSEYQLTYDANPNMTDLLKMYNVRVDNTDMDMLSRIIEYVKLAHRVLNISLFIFVNLRTYFSDDTLEQLFQTLQYEKIHILLIERHETSCLAAQTRIIIDKDSCVIYDS